MPAKVLQNEFAVGTKPVLLQSPVGQGKTLVVQCAAKAVGMSVTIYDSI